MIAESQFSDWEKISAVQGFLPAATKQLLARRNADSPSKQAAQKILEKQADSSTAQAYEESDVRPELATGDPVSTSDTFIDGLDLEPVADDQFSGPERRAIEGARRFVSRTYGSSPDAVRGMGRRLLRGAGGRSPDALFADVSGALRSAFDRRVVFIEGIPADKARGLLFPGEPDVILLNARADWPTMFLIGHEFGHSMKAGNPALYEELSNFVLSLAGDRTAHNAMLAEKQYAPEKWDDEFVNDFIGREFNDKGFWQAMADRDAGFFRRIAAAAMQYLNGLAKTVAGFPRDVTPYFADILSARLGSVDSRRASNLSDKKAEQPPTPLTFIKSTSKKNN